MRVKGAPLVRAHLRKERQHKGTVRIVEKERCSPKSSRQALQAMESGNDSGIATIIVLAPIKTLEIF